MIKVIIKIGNIIEKIFKILIIFSMASIVSIVVIQIFFRYVLNSPLIWTEELGKYLGTWLVMLSAGLVQRENGHIALELIPERYVAISRIFSNVVAILFSSFLVIPGIRFTIVTKNILLPALKIPYWIIHISMPIGFIFLAFYSIINIIEYASKTKR